MRVVETNNDCVVIPFVKSGFSGLEGLWMVSQILVIYDPLFWKNFDNFFPRNFPWDMGALGSSIGGNLCSGTKRFLHLEELDT